MLLVTHRRRIHQALLHSAMVGAGCSEATPEAGARTIHIDVRSPSASLRDASGHAVPLRASPPSSSRAGR